MPGPEHRADRLRGETMRPDAPHLAGAVQGETCGSGESAASRRAFLLLGLGVLLTGCAPQRRAATLPGPHWEPRPSTPERPAMPEYRPPRPPSPQPQVAAPTGLVPRSRWAGGRPAPSRMTRMNAVRYITVHHDGMDPFHASDESAAASRLESIRRFHYDRLNWGDIGYHYAIDRNGRIWECRPLTHQGAHVSNHNEGNIGVLTLGNFDLQAPTSAQLEALRRHVGWLMQRHRVPISRVRTHREWETARTACPGAALQRYMNEVRTQHALG